MTLQWVTQHYSLGAGLMTKGDRRAGDPPSLDIARDLQFDEEGGTQTRLPFATFGNEIFGGGTLTNCRRLAVVNDELCVFTDVALYSWNAQLSKWVLRGTHLAATVDEDPRFATTGDQIDGDRAELNGTVVFAWTEGSQVYAAAMDKTTKSVLVSQTAISAGVSKPRVVALATKILLFCITAPNNLVVRAIDPADPATGFASASTNVTAVAGGPYDVVKVDSQDLCVGAFQRTVTTSYTAFTVTPALVVTSSTKVRDGAGCLAVSTIPGGTQVQIVREGPITGAPTPILGDLLTTATLADVFTGQAIGTVSAGFHANQIAACHRSVTNGGFYRCYVFWDEQETISTSSAFQTKFNFVDNNNTLGAQATFLRLLGPASRAFDYAGSVYFWGVFATQSTFSGADEQGFRAQLQNTCFLYRDDGFLVAKALTDRAGGLQPSTGRLPGVALASGSTVYSWCGTQRRVIDVGADHQSFAARTPVDVTLTFDSNEARRWAQIGRTLYIPGAEVLQYDGTRIVELGYHIYPYDFGLIDAGGGSVGVGKYAYKLTWRYDNGQDELDRSTTATVGTVTVSGSSTSMPNAKPLFVTHKTAVAPAVEVWRTAVAPNVDSPFYLASSKDPTATANPNRYLANDTTLATLPTFNDFFADSTLTTKETNPENGGLLETIAPPPAKIIIATDTRLFLAGVAGQPDSVWYSKQRVDGSVAEFNDALVIPVPRPGGDITALAFTNETLTVFRQTAVYVLPGDGFNNLGQGANYGPARTISLDVGAVSQESVALTPRGTLFKSSKGWYLLTPSWTLQYVGASVNAFDGDTVHAVTVVESQHHVRILTGSRMLIWDYLSNPYGTELIGQWGEWTVSDGIHAVMWQGRHVYLTATGPKIQSLTHTGVTFGIDAETSWIKPLPGPLAQQGNTKVRWFSFLGEWRSNFLARIRVARDYQYDASGDPAYYDDVVWTPDTAIVGNALQVLHTPSQQSCEAIKVRFTAVTDAARATLLTTALSPQVATSGVVWTATWRAADAFPGEMGNRITMTVAFIDEVTVDDLLPYDLPFDFTGPAAIQVNDHFTWSLTLNRWVEDVNNIGILIIGTPTIGEVESVIVASTALATLQSADATPSKLIAMAPDTSSAAAFTGGAYGSPSGEACKLTGLAMDVGIRPGIQRRLTAAQKAG